MPTDQYTCLNTEVHATMYVSTKQVCICTLTAGLRALQACGWKCKTRAIVCAERTFAARKNRNTTGKNYRVIGLWALLRLQVHTASQVTPGR